MLEKVLLFYNPKAGNGVFSGNLDKVIDAFQKKGKVLVPVRADKTRLLNDLMKTAESSGFTKIIAAGGDGTINIVVSSMLKYDVHLPLALFPAGTANDLTHYFNIPDEIDDMLKIATGDKYTAMDVGTVNGRCFVNVLAMGMMVDVSQKTDPLFKNTLGVMAYYLRSVAELPKIHPIPIKITCPEREIDTTMTAMLVMNGRSAGGFKRAAPTASINDGLLDVILFQELPITGWAPLILDVLTGQHSDNRNVTFFRTSQMLIESSVEISTDMDGETGEPLPLDVRVLKRRLNICTLEPDMEGNVW